MKRKDIRKTLKKWVYNSSTTNYGHIWKKYVFTDVDSNKMSKEFESLVDEVYKMIGKEEV